MCLQLGGNVREKIIYEQKYIKPGQKLKKECLPQLKHTTKGYKCSEAYILKAGIAERDGIKREYQELRIYFTDTQEDK